MSLANRAINADVTPALSRLLSDAALWRAALGASGAPVALLDAGAGTRPVTYVNSAFERFFGYRRGEALGRSLAEVIFLGDEPLVHRLLAAPDSRARVQAWARDGSPREVELALGAVRNTEGRTTHWVVTVTAHSTA